MNFYMYLVSQKIHQSHKNVPLAQKNSHNWMLDNKTKSFWGLFCGTLERFYGTPDIYSHFFGTRPNLLRDKDTFLGHPIRVLTWELCLLNPNLETRLDFVTSPLGWCWGLIDHRLLVVPKKCVFIPNHLFLGHSITYDKKMNFECFN